MITYSDIFTGEIPIPLQQVVLGLSSLLLIFIIWLVRHERLKAGYSIIWIAVSAVMVIFSLHVGLLTQLSVLLGISYAPAVLLILLLVGVVFLALHFSLLFCRYDRRIRSLAQEHALLKEELMGNRVTKMKKALITGGAGFIGSHLAEYLLSKGYEVFVIDDLSTGSLKNLDHIKHLPALHITIADVRNKEVTVPIVNQVDYVYHLAASVGVKHIMENLVSSIRNNIEGTEAILEAASVGKKRTLVVSTSEVYGKTTDEPSKECDDLRMGNTIKSRWSYACSKALDEYMAFSYFHERELPVSVVRLFNTVGDRQTDAFGMVIPTFVKQALANLPITIHGDGQQTRCFVYVKDVIWALHKIMEREDTIGEVYNVGSTESVTINELADRVIGLTNSKSVKQIIPYEQAYKKGFDDAQRREPNIQKIHDKIGFEPKHTLNDIIKIVAESV